MHKLRLAALIAVLLLAPLVTWRVSSAQENFEYFRETGHFVRGEFLTFYHQVENPVELYGYPITEAFPDTATGRTVQYFEKARFELHPAETEQARVQLSPLGEYLYQPGQPQVPSGNAAACQSFPPSEFVVCYDFLAFYLANGGPAQFGLPISNTEYLNKDNQVQYFQNARLEWRPGRNGQTWIAVADLGWEYFRKIGENAGKTSATPRSDDIFGDIVELKARAYPLSAVSGRASKQTVYIIVYDQRAMRIPGVDVTITVHWPSGAESKFIAGLTDANGIAQISFPVASNEIGLATVQVNGVLDRIPINTVTSFRIWW